MAQPKLPDTDTKSPNPPTITPGPPKPVTVLTPLSQLKQQGPVSDENLLNHFKADPVNFIREINLIYNQRERVRLKQLLDKRLSGDRDLFNAWESAKAQLPNLRTSSLVLSRKLPTAQPQPVTPDVQEIPEYKPAETIEQKTPAPKNGINPNNAKQLEGWVNNVNSFVHDYFSKSGYQSVSAASSSKTFSQGFLSALSMYRGGLAQFYLKEGAQETLFSALGPVGDLMRQGAGKKLEWEMSWMKNPLNANAIYFYLQSLPTRKAFELLYIPAKATFGILARGGAPLISKTTYLETNPNSKNYGKVTQGYFFSPTLRGAQLSQSVADKLDKITNTPTDGDPFGLTGGNSPLEQFIRGKNQTFTEDLELLKIAKKSRDRTKIAEARKRIKAHLSQYDGSFWQQVYRKGLINTAKRFRRASQDPISFLFSLVGGSLWDVVMTATLRPIMAVANRLINLVPGVGAIRAQLTKIFTSNNVLNSISFSGRTMGEFVKGTFSPTTFSHGYIGYKTGQLLFPNAVASINIPLLGNLVVNPYGLIGGSILTSWGAFYTTALRLANNPHYFNYSGTGWVQKYNSYLAAGDNFAIKEGYLKGFKPGPLSRFANVLYRNWLVRLPINGWVAADFLSPLMERLYGWNATTTHVVFTAADYLWQIKGPLLQKLGTFLSNLPVVQRLAFWVESRVFYPFQKTWFNMVYKASTFEQSMVGGAPNFWQARTWTKFSQSFFNPGFVIGFGLIPWFSTFMPVPLAYIAAPVAGSLVWNGTAYVLERTFGMNLASMSKINAWGWTGYLVGSLLQLIIPGLPSWFSMLTAGLGVATGMILSTTWASNLLLSIGTRLIGAVPALAGATGAFATAIAAWSTAIAVGSIAVLTVFFGYTIYAGFWVPTIERAKAGPQSTNFSIDDTIEETAPNHYQLCSSFTISENVFNSQRYLIHETDFRQTYLTVNLTDPNQSTDAWRGQQLTYAAFNPDTLESSQYTIPLPITSPGEPLLVGAVSTEPVLQTTLSVPSTQKQNLFDLMSQNTSVVNTMRPFFDILTNLAKEHNQTAHLVAEYEAQLKILKEQQKLVDALLTRVKDNNLNGAIATANDYLTRNPLSDPCPPEQDCPEDKLGLKQLYAGWENLITNYIGTLTIYANQTNPQLEPLISSLQQESESLTQQIELLPEIVDQVEDIKMTDEDAAKILNPAFNFLNFTSMTEQEQNDVWDNLLAKHFKDVFNKNNTFYFIPSGTNYRVCVDAEYCYALDPDDPPTCPKDEPISVCSVISYQPSFWGPNTSFARDCTTFTP